MLVMKNWRGNRKVGESESFAYCSRISTFLLSSHSIPFVHILTSSFVELKQSTGIKAAVTDS